MMDGINKINDNISSFKRKYYLSLAMRGTLLTLSLLLFYFLVASIIEYNLWLGTTARLVIFSSFIFLVLFCIYRFMKEPITWWVYRKGLDQEDSAKMIGSTFPEIRDKLLNLIQLRLIEHQTPLLAAGILQKESQFDNMLFENAIDLRQNKRYLKYFLVPFILVLLILIVNRGILVKSTQRIVQFNQEFSPEAPFRFVIENGSLNAFFNEDFTLNVKLEGEAIPQEVYLVSGGQRLKLEEAAPGIFKYTFEKIQNDISFQLDASGFLSARKKIELVNRPELAQLKMEFEFPRYLSRRNAQVVNTGNAEVPEGTKITWLIKTSNSDNATVDFRSVGKSVPLQRIDDQDFKFDKVFHKAEQYEIELANQFSKNTDKISYAVDVIKDQFPEIEIDNVKDSVLYKSVFLGGAIEDDYGITQLSLNYEVVKNGKPVEKKIEIPVNTNLLQQSFFIIGGSTRSILSLVIR